MEVDEVQKPENVTGNMVYPSKIGNQEKEKGYDSKSSLWNCGSSKRGIVLCGVEVAISKETKECQKEDKTKGMIAHLITSSQNILVPILCPKALVIEVPTKDIPTPSNMCRPELSPLLYGNANWSTPLNNNHGSSSVQKNHSSNSAGNHPSTSVEHKVTNTVQKQPRPPKRISFINLAKLSPSLSSLKQSTVTTKESPVQIGTVKSKVDIPKKLPTVTPKGINFLSFGKGSVCSFKNVNRENGIKLPQLFNSGLPEQAKSSLNKDDYNKASDRTKQNEKNQSVAEEMKSKLPEKTSVDVFMTDHSYSESVQEGKMSFDNSQSSKGQKALLSTLAFAAEHESDIKMKYPTGAERNFC
ncbi:hypothetical protein GmHk_08G023978 [Glycine max]|nr:hypothetical protein GmHk_08G023978 [Glycine max]